MKDYILVDVTKALLLLKGRVDVTVEFIGGGVAKVSVPEIVIPAEVAS